MGAGLYGLGLPGVEWGGSAELFTPKPTHPCYNAVLFGHIWFGWVMVGQEFSALALCLQKGLPGSASCARQQWFRSRIQLGPWFIRTLYPKPLIAFRDVRGSEKEAATKKTKAFESCAEA